MLTLYDDKTIGNKEYIKDIEASFAFYKDAIVKLPQLAEICIEMNNLNKIVTIQKKIVNQRTNETYNWSVQMRSIHSDQQRDSRCLPHF